MKPEIRERRSFMLETYGRSFSVKEAVKHTAKKFGVEETTLYVDWSRRNRWIKELFSLRENDTLTRQMILDIFRILRNVEGLGSDTNNDNIKLGALKLAINIRLKLIDLLRDFQIEDIAERIEKLERMVRKVPMRNNTRDGDH